MLQSWGGIIGMDRLLLAKVHKVQLEIANEVKRICDKYHITYFLIAGTLLGAVRHKGFIPWDDDLDIGMLRKDYIRFLKIARKELKDYYFLETWKVSPGYGMPFAKIRKNGTKYIERNSKNVNCHPGIYIDIFPFDHVPNSKLLRLIHEYQLKFYQYVILELCNYKVSLNNKSIKGFIYNLLKQRVKGFHIKYLKKKYEMISKKYNKKPTEFVLAVGGSYGYKKETIKFSWVSQTDELDFEGHSFKVPKGYKEYLACLYGDFMTPPPTNQRYNRHDIIEVNFFVNLSR